MPIGVLLDSYAVLNGDHEKDDLLSDIETLRGICGCLIEITDRNQVGDGQIATVAHYTVREYMESNRGTLNPGSGWVKINHETCYSGILDRIFEYAITATSPPLDSGDEGGRLTIDGRSSLRDYCVASSGHALAICEGLVKHELAFRLSNPSEPHYTDIEESLWREGFLLRTEGRPKFSTGGRSTSAVVLINLLLSDCFVLAEHLGRQVDMEHLLREGISSSNAVSLSRSTVPVHGNLLTIAAQLWKLDGYIVVDFEELLSCLRGDVQRRCEYQKCTYSYPRYPEDRGSYRGRPWEYSRHLGQSHENEGPYVCPKDGCSYRGAHVTDFKSHWAS